MKTTVSIIAISAMFITGGAYAASLGSGSHGHMGYSGTGASRGGFVSKTGFVKERTNEEDHMDGKPADDKDAKPAAGEGDEPDAGDVGGEADDMDGGTDEGEGERDE